MGVGVFFFFKQKTAYEMRISDWSSDVCSSDLEGHRAQAVADHMDALVACDLANRPDCLRMIVERAVVHRPAMRAEIVDVPVAHAEIEGEDVGEDLRSEEHTSELQSLMRISYAVFCLTQNIVYTR